ncbi:DoxX family protein [Ferruginibacter albus]|uniref:DoxX family protein n=1 Tax=Ferruginibacter albus TaxID=2875540 RepID=UPI001CC3D8E2|nr:DoxX family protein [Ferruginibacter albus]UAY52570.1 DoxX family protein [Ferruginibacter albus]
MTQKTRKIIGWVFTGLLALVFISSAFMKIKGGAQASQGAAALGISLDTLKLIAIVEILSISLFIIPRSGLLGTLLLAAYLGGAIATHLEHGQPVMFPIIIEIIVWITAVIRFPELSKRLATAQ